MGPLSGLQKTKTKKDFEIDTKNQELGLFLFVYKKIFTFFGVTKLNIYLINTLNILYLLQNGHQVTLRIFKGVHKTNPSFW